MAKFIFGYDDFEMDRGELAWEFEGPNVFADLRKLDLGKEAKSFGGALKDLVFEQIISFPAKGSIEFNKPKNSDEEKRKAEAMAIINQNTQTVIHADQNYQNSLEAEYARNMQIIFGGQRSQENINGYLKLQAGYRGSTGISHLVQARQEELDQNRAMEKAEKAKKQQAVQAASGPEHLLDTMAEGNKMSGAVTAG